MSNTTSLDEIHSQLENIESDLMNGLDSLESEAPEHMNFRRVNEARKDLAEQVKALRTWMDNFNVGELEIRNW